MLYKILLWFEFFWGEGPYINCHFARATSAFQVFGKTEVSNWRFRGLSLYHHSTMYRGRGVFRVCVCVGGLKITKSIFKHSTSFTLEIAQI